MKKDDKEDYEVRSWTPEDCEEEMLHDLEVGKDRGSTTHIDEFDKAWTWRKSEANIWSGYTNEGKSTFLKFLSLLKALEDDWKFVFNSPEDYPAKEFYDDYIATIAGKTTDKSNKDNILITPEEYKKCNALIKNRFDFLYIKPPQNTIENCLREFQKKQDEFPRDGFVLDPLMKFQKSKDAPDRPEDYITYVLTLLTDFSRVNNVSTHLVIHQVTPKPLEGSGLYPKPSHYNIRNGGAAADGIDNVLFVQRPNYAKDKIDPGVLVGSQKIKKQKLTGVPQDLTFSFDRKTNRYTYADGSSLYNFSKHLK